MSINNRNTIKYVYDLPYTERMEVCKILDMNDKWEILAGKHMQYDMMTIQELRREARFGSSPTDKLLERWGQQNHTITELFGHLSKMQHYRAMSVIKGFVSVEFHRLIKEGEGNLARMFAKEKTNQETVYKNETQMNFNQSQSSNLLPSKLVNGNVSNDTESKILNIPVGIRTSVTGDDAPTAVVNNNNIVDSNRTPVNGEHSKEKERLDVAAGVETVGLPMIPYKELEIATQGWDATAILGKGGFGTVYKGVWKNTAVAVKKSRSTEADENQRVQIQQIFAELHMLNSYRHDNILPLYGYSVGGDDPCLIYQYMPHGSLEDRLLCRQGTPPLSWSQRLVIAVETARGLQFLHTINEKPLIHGDIKSANILLDSNFKPKIGDFGLAREGPQSHLTHMKVSRVHGTRPYLPDEFLRAKKFSTKVDTYSFGIVLYELSTGLRAYDEQRSHKFLRDLIENSSDIQISNLIDRRAQPDDQQVFESLIEFGKVCVSTKPKDRPEMVKVLQDLESVKTRRDAMLRAQQQVQRNSLTPVSPYELQLLHDHLSQQRNNNGSPIPDSRISPRVLSPQPRISSPMLDGRINGRMVSPLPEDPYYPRVISPLPENRVSPLLHNHYRPENRVSPLPLNGGRVPPSSGASSTGSQYNPSMQNNNTLYNPALNGKVGGIISPPSSHPGTNPFIDNVTNPGSARLHNTGIVPPHLRQQITNGLNQVPVPVLNPLVQSNSPLIAVSPPSFNNVSSTQSHYSTDLSDEITEGPIPVTVCASPEPISEDAVHESRYSGIIPLISELGIKNNEGHREGGNGIVEEPTASSSVSAPSTAKGKTLIF